MDIQKVRFNENKRPFVSFIVKTGNWKGKEVKMFGKIKNCIKCNKEFFAPDTYSKRGGAKFCSPHCSNSYHPDNLNGRWKGGIKKRPDGYIRILIPQTNKYEYEHRIVVQSFRKKPLDKNEVVHHINGNTSDNRIENLTVMRRVDHMQMHKAMNKSQC